MDLVPFQIPAYPKPLSISQARVDFPPEEFRLRLRKHLLDHPGLTLAQVARDLKITRQRVGGLVGKLDRPRHFAVKREEARARMIELRTRVANGESAEKASTEMGISLAAAVKAGFRSKDVRPAHGTQARMATGCNCWRCRRAAGIAVPRGTKMGPRVKAQVLDLLAWRDPDDQTPLTQATIGRLTNCGQAAVSRIARAAE